MAATSTNAKLSLLTVSSRGLGIGDHPVEHNHSLSTVLALVSNGVGMVPRAQIASSTRTGHLRHLSLAAGQSERRVTLILLTSFAKEALACYYHDACYNHCIDVGSIGHGAREHTKET